VARDDVPAYERYSDRSPIPGRADTPVRRIVVTRHGSGGASPYRPDRVKQPET